ncbi:hypothetical protein JCM1841_002648 [Sporobolomyces salmonicolor]
MRSFALSAAALALSASSAYAGAVVSDPNNLPHTTESGQYGYNDCTKYGDSPSANCQTLWLNSIDDFCLWAPPKKATIGDSERYLSLLHSASRPPSRPNELLFRRVHFQQTDKYIRKFTKMNIPAGDEGGELDPHGADGNGNPIGAIVLTNIGGKTQQLTEWNQFISDEMFCIRACWSESDGPQWCNHIYDVMGCMWNDPGNYNSGSFDTCAADTPAMPMGEYKLKNGATSTWHQGVSPTPAGQNPGKSSQCVGQKTISAASYSTAKTVAAAAVTTKKATTTMKKVTTTSTKKASTTKKATTTTKKITTSTKKASTTTKKASTTTKKASTTTKKASTTTKKPAATTHKAKRHE